MHLATIAQSPITKDLADKVGNYLRASKSQNTQRAYRASWRAFRTWCEEHGLVALPAAPEAVVAFLADQAGVLKVSTIELRLAAIRQAHDLAHLPSPTKSVEVRTIMQGIRRQHGMASTKKTALMVGDIRALCGRLDDDLRGLRDRALLLLGFTGGFRRSELVGLNVEDICFKAGGMVITIRRAKTDQAAAGRTIGIGHGAGESTCPVTAIRRWLGAAGIESGPLLRGVNRHGKVMSCRMSSHSVGRLVKALGERVGLDPKVLGGHSLRSGFASSAAAAGVEERDIARVTGHKSLAVLRGYVQQGTMFEGDVVRRLGL